MSLRAMPEGWGEVEVGSVANVSGGKRLPKGKLLTSAPNGHPYIRVTDMRMGHVETLDLRYVPEDVAQSIERYRVNADDLIMSVAGTLGVVCRIPDQLAGANLTENADRIVPEACDAGYLLHALQSDSVQDEIGSISTVGAQPKLALEHIRRFRVMIPHARSEQEQITEALDDADALIAGLERMIAKKEAVKQGMMQQILTGRTRLPGFRSPWKEVRFAQLATPRRERHVLDNNDADQRVVDLDGLEPGTGRLLSKDSPFAVGSVRTVFREGDILFGKLRAYLRKFWLADVDGYCSTEIWALKPEAGVSAAFVRQMVASDQFIAAAAETHGTHMPRSDWNIVGALMFAIPDRNEQHAIAKVLTDIDDQIVLFQRRCVQARQIKEGMMQQLLAGRVRLPADDAV